VLDFGSGTGNLALRIAERGARSVAAVDLSPGMCAVLRRKLASKSCAQKVRDRIQIYQEALTHADQLASRRFDLVVSSLTMHHLGELPSLLSLLASFLRVGGCLVVLDLELTADSPLFHQTSRREHGDCPHLDGFTRDELLSVMRSLPFFEFPAVQVAPPIVAAHRVCTCCARPHGDCPHAEHCVFRHPILCWSAFRSK